MKSEDVRNISVLGAGIMGHGIAQSFILGGYPVVLYDTKLSILETAKAHILESLKSFREAGLVGQEDIQQSLERLTLSLNLAQAVRNSDFIIEAAPEDLSVKRQLFEEVEGHCKKDAIIASNTSSLTITSIGEHVDNKGRLLITHWFNPPQIVPTVEVVRGKETTDENMETVCNVLTGIKKLPVQINKEVPGFLVNRVQIAMAREILDLYERGVACAEDIDKAISGSIGFRLASIGPLRTMDLAGLKLWLKVCTNLLPHIQNSQDAPRVLEKLTSQGNDGIKSGKGFYEYGLEFSKAGLDEAIKKRDSEFLGRLKALYWRQKELD